VRGGSFALSNRLVALIREADGVVENGREADTLLLDGRHIAGLAITRATVPILKPISHQSYSAMPPSSSRRNAAGRKPGGVLGALCRTACLDFALDDRDRA